MEQDVSSLGSMASNTHPKTTVCFCRDLQLFLKTQATRTRKHTSGHTQPGQEASPRKKREIEIDSKSKREITPIENRTGG